MRDLLNPTIAYAQHGFPLTPVIARAWQTAETLLRADPGVSETFLPHGVPPKSGGIFSNTDLSATLLLISECGRDAFYRGSIAREIVTVGERLGGYFTRADLADHLSTWVEPVGVTYRGYEVWKLPPNT